MENKNNEIQCAACGFVGERSEFFNSAMHTKFVICPKCGMVRFLCDSNKEFRCKDQEDKRKRTVINRYSPMDIKEDDLFVYQGDQVRALPGAEEYDYTPGKFYEVADCGYDIIRVNDDRGFCRWISVKYFEKV
ncbi:MAG: hypothetical protein [Bacteriophage sp.]|nr:MAG: hypothetical protein [Bacteriophage sp.]